MSATQQTPEEVRSAYIEKMGQKLGELFHATSEELTEVHWRWNQYRVLFGEKPSRIDLLNEAAPFFFRIVHDVLFEDTMLAIARLVGPIKSAGKPNLSIERFLPLLADTKLHDEVDLLIRQVRDEAAFTQEYRNRRIAHRDLGLSLGKSAMLAAVTRQSIEKCLATLRDILDRIEDFYCNAHTAYTFSPDGWGAKALLYVIRDGLLRRKEKRECWHRLERHQDDINPPGEI